MESSSIPVAPDQKRILRWRLFWFVAGSVVNYLLISTPFKWLRLHTSLDVWIVSACSMAVSTSFFFLWNYFVNFRTDIRKRDALPRYLIAVGVMWLLSSSTLALLEKFGGRFAWSFGNQTINLNIVATQFMLAGLKFPLYHRWAFPMPRAGRSVAIAEDQA